MRKLLILAYDFPPYISVGSLRPDSWYKYLHLYNVYPIVVTRQWSNKYGSGLDYIAPGYSGETDTEVTDEGTILKSPFKPHLGNRLFLKYGENRFRLLRKLITSYYEFFQFVILTGNKRNIYKAADEFLKGNKIDCIIVTGDPFILFEYGAKLSRKYSIPWIADYRDAWVQDKTVTSRIYRVLAAFFEKRALKNVSKITTVSNFIRRQIGQNIKDKNFEILHNGYDPKILEVTKEIEQNRDGILSVAFAGTIYDWHPIESFLSVCSELVEEKPDFKLQINFYGINREEQIRKLLDSRFRSLKKFISFHRRMPNLDLAKEMRKQNICLLFNDYSILGTKIFDYLAIGRKIILCYENDAESLELKRKFYNLVEMETESRNLQADVINATNSGIIIKDSEHLKTTLLELSEELNVNGFIKCESVNTDAYSRIRQVERLAQIVKKIR